MANYLDMEFIDAAEVIFFDENGNFDEAKRINACPNVWRVWNLR